MKVTNPMMSMDASGTLNKAITFTKWKGLHVVRQYVIPVNRDAMSQLKIRDIVRKASIAWKNNVTIGTVVINPTYKALFNTAASGFAYSGFNLFISVCIAKNGGIAFSGTLVLPANPNDRTPPTQVEVLEVQAYLEKYNMPEFTYKHITARVLAVLKKRGDEDLYDESFFSKTYRHKQENKNE